MMTTAYVSRMYMSRELGTPREVTDGVPAHAHHTTGNTIQMLIDVEQYSCYDELEGCRLGFLPAVTAPASLAVKWTLSIQTLSSPLEALYGTS